MPRNGPSRPARVAVAHTFCGDLVVELVSPSAATVVLHNHRGGANAVICEELPSRISSRR
jgi:subtilisin-like proprotein convertase family protein